MSAKIILNLLQKISTKKDMVHNIGMKYCKASIEFYHQIENYVFIKNSNVTPFKSSEEFASLREKIKIIEDSITIVNEMFELEEDIEKLKAYVNRGQLVPEESVNKNNSSIINEASEFLKQAEKYIFVTSNEKIILSQRFEFFRIESIIEKCKGSTPSDEDLRKISIELNKLKGFIKDGSAISFDKLEMEIKCLDAIVARLEKFDKSLYSQSDYPKISLLKTVFEKEHEVEKRANALYKFVGKDIPHLISVIKENCSKIELKPNLRLNDEKESLTKLRDKEIFDVETEYLRSKNKGGFLFGARGGLTNSQRKQRVKEIKERYATKWHHFEKNIDSILSEERSMINNNLKLIEELEAYLFSNISGLRPTK